MRMNIADDVAIPRSAQPTLAWTETMNAVLQKPIPAPSSKAPVPAQRKPLAGVSAISMMLPAISVRPPIEAASRYEVRIIRRAAAMLANAQATDETASTIPEAVAS